MKTKILTIIIILALAIMMTGCGYQQTTQQTQTPATQETTQQTAQQPTPAGNLGIKQDIEISGFSFNPNTITIPTGATVIWTNKDSVPHTIISDSGSELSSDSIPNGGTYAHTFTTTGTYTYHCSIHPSMKGTIVVQ